MSFSLGGSYIKAQPFLYQFCIQSQIDPATLFSYDALVFAYSSFALDIFEDLRDELKKALNIQMQNLYLEMMLLRKRSDFSEASVRSFLSNDYISSFTVNLMKVYSSEPVTEKDVFYAQKALIYVLLDAKRPFEVKQQAPYDPQRLSKLNSSMKTALRKHFYNPESDNYPLLEFAYELKAQSIFPTPEDDYNNFNNSRKRSTFLKRQRDESGAEEEEN